MSGYTVSIGEGDGRSTWPHPFSERLGEVEWSLRYGEPTRSDLLVAAHVLAAYRGILDAGSYGAGNRIDVARALMRAVRS